MTLTLPDGTIVEYAWASNLPPGASGQHVSKCYLWVRWGRDGPWAPSKHRSLHAAIEWFNCCEGLTDFLEGER